MLPPPPRLMHQFFWNTRLQCPCLHGETPVGGEVRAHHYSTHGSKFEVHGVGMVKLPSQKPVTHPLGVDTDSWKDIALCTSV